jgi:DNA-binding response OmpR family regulator
MKLATLFGNRQIEEFALSACVERNIELTRFHSIASLLSALNNASFDAFVLEDEARQLGHWLTALQLCVNCTTPIIVFGEGMAFSISRALQCGASDYATQSAGPYGLISRVEARISAQSDKKKNTQLKIGAFLLNAQSQCLHGCGTEVSLTFREFSLAWALFENIGQVLTFKTLSIQIWGHAGDASKRTIEQHIYKLRRKFSDVMTESPDLPCIQTVYGIGYRLMLPKQQSIMA